MAKFLYKLKLSWVFWKYWPCPKLPAGYWTTDDAKMLSIFLGSHTGTKLRNVLVERMVTTQERAIMDGSESKFANGVAWGVRGTVMEIESRLKLSLPTDESLALTEEQLDGVFRSVNY